MRIKLTYLKIFKHRGEAVLRNTCANGTLANKHNYYKGLTVVQKLLIKRLGRNLINSVNSYKLLYTCIKVRSTNIYNAIIFHSLDTLNKNNDYGTVVEHATAAQPVQVWA